MPCDLLLHASKIATISPHQVNRYQETHYGSAFENHVVPGFHEFALPGHSIILVNNVNPHNFFFKLVTALRSFSDLAFASASSIFSTASASRPNFDNP